MAREPQPASDGGGSGGVACQLSRDPGMPVMPMTEASSLSPAMIGESESHVTQNVDLVDVETVIAPAPSVVPKLQGSTCA